MLSRLLGNTPFFSRTNVCPLQLWEVYLAITPRLDQGHKLGQELWPVLLFEGVLNVSVLDDKPRARKIFRCHHVVPISHGGRNNA